MAPLPFLREIEGGVELTVLAQPRASRSKVVGIHDGQLKIAVAAPPVEGEANAALIEFLAKWLRVPKRQVELLQGDTGRRKRFRVLGVTAAAVEAVMT